MADDRPEPAWTKRWQCYDQPGEKVRKQGGLASREAALGPDRGLTTRASRSQAGRIMVKDGVDFGKDWRCKPVRGA
jgi:hypothetical protein